MLRLARPVLFVSQWFPPAAGGSATIVKNLTDAFAPGSMVLAVDRPPSERALCRPSAHPVYHFMSAAKHSRLDGFWRSAQMPVAVWRLASIALHHECCAVVGVYPDAFAIDAALLAAKALKIPFIAYLHDTIAEGMAHTRWGQYGRAVQERVFEAASTLFVMSEGMADLYRKKYGVASVPLVHSYPEAMLYEESAAGRETEGAAAFWSGSIYRINQRAVRRVYEAVKTAGALKFNVASSQGRQELQALGIDGENVNRRYFAANERAAYLEFLRRQTFNVLALDWADESSVHVDELATIFPTKTPEYLASGRPVLVHCPEHYFLARFFRERKCGVVVSERTSEALSKGIAEILRNGDELGRRAMEAARMFDRGVVAAEFLSGINQALGVAGPRR